MELTFPNNLSMIPDHRKKDYDSGEFWNTQVPEFSIPKGPAAKPVGPWKTTKQAAFAMLRNAPKLYNYTNSVIDQPSTVYSGDVVGGGNRRTRKRRRKTSNKKKARTTRSRISTVKRKKSRRSN